MAGSRDTMLSNEVLTRLEQLPSNGDFMVDGVRFDEAVREANKLKRKLEKQLTPDAQALLEAYLEQRGVAESISSFEGTRAGYRFGKRVAAETGAESK